MRGSLSLRPLAFRSWTLGRSGYHPKPSNPRTLIAAYTSNLGFRWRAGHLLSTCCHGYMMLCQEVPGMQQSQPDICCISLGLVNHSAQFLRSQSRGQRPWQARFCPQRVHRTICTRDQSSCLLASKFSLAFRTLHSSPCSSF